MQILADYWLFVPTDPLPGTPRAGEPFPLVIFVHGSGATNADPYLAWIEHLVRRGAVVLYPQYQGTTPANGVRGRTSRMTCAAPSRRWSARGSRST